MTLTSEIAFVLLTYIWGSIPYGYILIKRHTGQHILEMGSGTVGSTNVRRVAGKKLSVITQLLDMFKGIFPVALFMYFSKKNAIDFSNYIYFLALATIIGHNFSIFLKFKGGKGVNTTQGASLLIAPYSVLISPIIFYMVKWRFKYVSMGSIALGISLPLIEFIVHRITPTFYYLLICAILIIFMHRNNIKRLLRKKELLS